MVYATGPFGAKAGSNPAYSSGGSGGGSQLPSGLFGYWKLNEASGTRADSVGSNNLTDNNTVTSAAKGVGAPANMPATVASFASANSESLSVANITMPADYTALIWVNPIANAAFQCAMACVNTWASKSQMSMLVQSANNMYAEIGNGVTSKTANKAGLIDGAWTMWTTTYDSATTDFTIRLADGAPATVNLGSTRDSTPGPLWIGNAFNGPSFWNGLLSSAMIWSRVLSNTEIAAMYNSGSGLFL